MKFNKKHAAITALLGATAVVSSFAAGSTVNSQTNGTIKSGAGRARHSQAEIGNAEQKAKMIESLAAVLGTTKESVTAQIAAGKSPRDIIKASGLDEATVQAQLEAAHESDMKTRLQADVTTGKLTQAEADAKLLEMKNHTGKGKGKIGGRIGNDTMLTDMASVLGVTKEALQAQMTAGKTPTDIAKASGMTEEVFHTKMHVLRTLEMKTKLAADVASGKITQAKADEMIQNMEAHKGGVRGMNNHTKKTTATTVKA